jgi:hypothetical protein
MARRFDPWRGSVDREIEDCARRMFIELTRGAPRRDLWYGWYLCERHGGPPLIDPWIPAKQVAYWDGEDIVIAAKAPIREIVDALPEELAHRLASAGAARFETMNYLLRYSRALDRTEFQERVGQRVAQLFAEGRARALTPRLPCTPPV